MVPVADPPERPPAGWYSEQARMLLASKGNLFHAPMQRRLKYSDTASPPRPRRRTPQLRLPLPTMRR